MQRQEERELRARQMHGPAWQVSVQRRGGRAPPAALISTPHAGLHQAVSQPSAAAASHLKNLRDHHLGGAEVFKQPQDQRSLISQ